MAPLLTKTRTDRGEGVVAAASSFEVAPFSESLQRFETRAKENVFTSRNVDVCYYNRKAVLRQT